MKEKILLLMMLSIFAVSLAFSGGANAGAGGAAYTGSGPVEITMALSFNGAEPPPLGSPAQRIIEEYTNTRLLPTFYANMGSIYPALLASGDMPDIVTASNNALTRDVMREGVFWDLNRFLPETNNLKNTNPLILLNATVEGMLIGVPQRVPVVRRIILYRKDWANNLGLSEPRTIPEFYEFVRAMTFDDPTGTGARTFGLAVPALIEAGLDYFSIFHGAPNGWDIRNGAFISQYETPEYLEAMRFLRRLYAEGILYPEWATVSRNQQNIIFQEGMVLGSMLNNTNSYLQNGAPLEARIPGAEVAGFTHLVDPRGNVRTKGEPGLAGFLSIPSTVSEAKAGRIIRFMDQLADEPMASLMIWGIEGVHHTMQNGLAVPIPGTDARLSADIRYPWELTVGVVRFENFAKPGVYNKFLTMQFETENQGERYAVTNPSYPLFSPTLAERGASLDQIVLDATVRFINGLITEAQFQAEVTRWKNQGGDQVAREYAEAYNSGR